MAPKTFGDWLKEKRVAARFTQEGLAHAAGSVCTGAYISALERNADVGKSGRPTRPDQSIVDALARALGAPVSENVMGRIPAHRLNQNQSVLYCAHMCNRLRFPTNGDEINEQL